MDLTRIEPLAALAAAWLLFFSSHSLLAGETLTRWFGQRSRIAFNVLSLLMLALPMGLLAMSPGELVWHEPPAWRWAANGLTLLALLGFAHTLKYYSLASFAGFKTESWPLTFSPWHRWVRHPWYFLLLILIWTRPMTDAWLVSALCMTAYLIVGSRIEERRILGFHPGSYAAYRRIVPGLLPWRGRALSLVDKGKLEALARSESPTPNASAMPLEP